MTAEDKSVFDVLSLIDFEDQSGCVFVEKVVVVECEVYQTLTFLDVVVLGRDCGFPFSRVNHIRESAHFWNVVGMTVFFWSVFFY